MIPTEQEGTVAVDAAARTLATPFLRDGITWEDLQPLQQNAFREQVLPLVWAALEALPDRAEILLREQAASGSILVDGDNCGHPRDGSPGRSDACGLIGDHAIPEETP